MALACMIGTTHGHAATLTAMTIGQQDAQTAIQLFVTEKLEHQASYLPADPDSQKPARFFVDFFPAQLAPSFLVPTLDQHPTISDIRVGKNAPDRIRLVFDLTASGQDTKFSLETNSKGIQILTQGQGKVVSSSSVDIAVQANKQTLKTPKAPKTTSVNQSKPSPKTNYRIIIDPGHGGKDPGAHGSRGGLEKNVVLAISKKVRDMLARNKRYDLFMTRKTDVFIPLLDRTQFANQKKGDLFVSIHANASPRKAAKGVSTYFLNNADDQESLRVAMRENGELDPSKLNIPTGSDDYYLELMKASMVKNFHTSQSTDLARWVQQNMVADLRKNYSDVVDLGVRSARFYVLTGSTMPSILVETSFISNPTEEKRLTSSTYQTRMAQSIVKGIEAYISEIEKRQEHTAMLR